MKGLRSIPADWAALVAWDWMRSNVSMSRVMLLLESDVGNDRVFSNDDARWLLDKLRDIPELDNIWDRWMWVREIMSFEENPRAKYYRAQALWWFGDRADCLRLMRPSAEAGFAPAMGWLGGSGIGGDDSDENLAFLHKAAELNDPYGLYYLALRCHDIDEMRRFKLLRAAAAQGLACSMYLLAVNYAHLSSPVEAAVYAARYVLLTSDNVSDAFRFRVDTHNAQVLFAVGRELEGYEESRHLLPQPADDWLRCIDAYQTVTQRARQAALQTVVALRARGLVRDVACMIGRLVYQTREADPEAWCYFSK